MLRRKLYVTALGFLGPEFIFQIALGQWISARHSVKDFHASGYTQWTMRHAFLADMGGFVLHTRDWTPFPIDAKQLHYLMTEGYIKFPTLDQRIIADKNKVDGLLRLITLCQILWFIVNISGRAAQHLTITCGELTTAAFIVCSVGTTFCWVYKPADLATPEIIETDVSMVEILLKAGDRASKPYSRTPLDFVSRKEWPWSLYWSNWINILRNMRINFGPWIRPVNRFENTISLELSRGMVLVFLGLTAVYSAIFISGWNYSFPTLAEQTLWRAASLTMMGTLVAYWSITEFTFSIYPAIQQRFTSSVTQSRQQAGHGRFVRKAKSVAACIRNNSVSQDPALNVPLKAILPIYIVAFFYCHARAYIFIADIIELRALPATAYSTVKWSNFIPHL
ncbi:hypothetical protein MMC24_001824 [Lignoscripta atroalba]|nr:hypothetical protein [Lignoscripta atroalba]